MVTDRQVSDRQVTEGPTNLAALLLLADGRLPTGGYAHSGGIEAAVGAGRVADLADLRAFLDGRLATTGVVDAAAATLAWAVTDAGRPETATVDLLDREVAARIPSPALRAAGRSQARGLLRVADRAWPGCLPAQRPETWPVALGIVGRVAGLAPAGVASVAASAAVTGPAWAAVRLLGLDSIAVAATLADLSADLDLVAAGALAWADPDRPPADLPALGGPLLDIGAQHHATWEVRLFAS